MQHSVPSFLPVPLTVLSNRKNIKKLMIRNLTGEMLPLTSLYSRLTLMQVKN